MSAPIQVFRRRIVLFWVTDEIFAFLLGNEMTLTLRYSRRMAVTGLLRWGDDPHRMMSGSFRCSCHCAIIWCDWFNDVLLLYRLIKHCQDVIYRQFNRTGDPFVSWFSGDDGFHRRFWIFHELIFTNDLWLLDPKTSVLINIVPEPYFIHLSANGTETLGNCFRCNGYYLHYQ